MIGLTSLVSVALSVGIVAASNSSYAENALIAALTGVFALIYLCLALAIYVVNAIFLMKLFAKANVPAWKAWVPFVNLWKFFELGGYPGALSLLYLATVIPFVGWAGTIIAAVFACLAAYQISLKNGKDGAWVVLYIFLGIVWTGILGLGRSTWNDSLGKPALGPERPPSYPNNYGGGSYGGGQQGGYNPPPPPPPSANY